MRTGFERRVSDAWHEAEDMTAPTRWTPTPPWSGEGWVLVAKYDTEDGPCAMFVKPMFVTPNAGHEATAVRPVASMNQFDGGKTEDV